MHLRDKIIGLRTTIERKVEELQTYQPSNVQLSPDITQQAELAEENKQNMQDISKAVRKQHKTVESLVESCRQLQTLFENFAKQMSEALPQSLIGSCIREVAKFQGQMVELQTKREDKITQILGITFDTFLQENLKMVMTMRKKFDKDLKDYDTSLSKLKAAKANKKMTPMKIQELEQEVQTYKEIYEQSEKQTLELLRQANQKAEVLTIIKLVEYWEAYGNYFREGLQYFESLGPKIEKFKKYVYSVRAPQDDPKVKVFHVPLEKLVQRECRRVPRLVVYCCNWVINNMLETQGVFRLSAIKSEIDETKVYLDKGGALNFASKDNPHLVTGVLKAFLRDLPNPLLTFERYEDFIKTYKMEGDEQVKQLKSLIDSLPEPNRKSLQHIVKMCVLIDEKSSINKMTAANLATVLAPNILYPKTPDPINMVQEMEIANVVFTKIITEYNKIFPDDDLHVDAFVEEPSAASPSESKPNRLARKKSKRFTKSEKSEADGEKPQRATLRSSASMTKKRTKRSLTSSNPQSPRARSESTQLDLSSVKTAGNGATLQVDDSSSIATDESSSHASMTPRELEESIGSEGIEENKPTPPQRKKRTKRKNAEEDGASTPRQTPRQQENVNDSPAKNDGEQQIAAESSSDKNTDEQPKADNNTEESPKPDDELRRSTDTLPQPVRRARSTSTGSGEAAKAVETPRSDKADGKVEEDGELELPPVIDELHVLVDLSYVSELADSICNFVHSAYASYFTEKELEELNVMLKAVAQSTKSILTGLKDVIDAFPNRENELSESALALQSELRNIVMAVKELHGNPNDLELREKLLSFCQTFANIAWNYLQECFNSTKAQIDSSIKKAIQVAAGTVAQILRGVLSQTLAEDIASIDTQMRDDMSNLVRLTDLRGCLMDGYESKALAATTDEMIENANVFLEKTAAFANDMDNELAATEVRTLAKSLVNSFRAVESAIESEQHKEVNESKLRQKLAKFTKCLMVQNQEGVNANDRLHISTKDHLAQIEAEIAKWTVEVEYFAPPDMLNSINVLTAHALTVLAMAAKSRITDDISNAEQQTLLVFMSANLIYHIRIKFLVTVNALEQNPDMLSLLLQNLIRLINTLRALMA